MRQFIDIITEALKPTLVGGTVPELGAIVLADVVDPRGMFRGQRVKGIVVKHLANDYDEITDTATLCAPEEAHMVALFRPLRHPLLGARDYREHAISFVDARSCNIIGHLEDGYLLGFVKKYASVSIGKQYGGTGGLEGTLFSRYIETDLKGEKNELWDRQLARLEFVELDAQAQADLEQRRLAATGRGAPDAP